MKQFSTREIHRTMARYELEPDEFQTAEEKAIRILQNPNFDLELNDTRNQLRQVNLFTGPT